MPALGLAFWPDASAAQVKNSFHVLLYRLRKALGRADLVVIDDERYQINPELATWFDAGQFERELTAARRDPARLEDALSLYGGDLAAEETVGDWAVEVNRWPAPPTRRCPLAPGGPGGSVRATRRRPSSCSSASSVPTTSARTRIGAG